MSPAPKFCNIELSGWMNSIASIGTSFDSTNLIAEEFYDVSNLQEPIHGPVIREESSSWLTLLSAAANFLA